MSIDDIELNEYWKGAFLYFMCVSVALTNLREKERERDLECSTIAWFTTIVLCLCDYAKQWKHDQRKNKYIKPASVSIHICIVYVWCGRQRHLCGTCQCVSVVKRLCSNDNTYTIAVYACKYKYKANSHLHNVMKLA